MSNMIVVNQRLPESAITDSYICKALLQNDKLPVNVQRDIEMDQIHIIQNSIRQ